MAMASNTKAFESKQRLVPELEHIETNIKRREEQQSTSEWCTELAGDRDLGYNAIDNEIGEKRRELKRSRWKEKVTYYLYYVYIANNSRFITRYLRKDQELILIYLQDF